ncbi:MAG: O-antigen ligase family protein [Thermoanaerobaculia bacterium]
MSATPFLSTPAFRPASSAPLEHRPARKVARNAKAREAGLKGRVVLSTLVCGVPPAVLLGTGQLTAAGRLFWLLLAAVLVRLVILGRAGELLCILVATSPLVALFREFAFYNVVVAVFALGVLFAAYRAPAVTRSVIRGCPLFVALALAMSLYWCLSFVLTGSYTQNFRMFELILAVLATLLIQTKPEMPAAALAGLIPAACVTGLAMLPHLGSLSAERLGMISIGGFVLGNPISLGAPLALGLLALVVDGGHTLRQTIRPFHKAVAILGTVALLGLTSSRAAWLVAAVGLAVSLLLGQGRRLRLLLSVGIVAVVVSLLLQIPAGGAFERGLQRTFGGERSARQRTTGRSDQWRVAWLAATESAGALLYGYGPGHGPDVYARYSLETPEVQYGVGERVALHSLLMQIGVEAGLLGLVPVALWLGIVLRKVWRHGRNSGLLFPLVCFLGYGVIVLTVSGNDVFSGLLLGIALSATVRRPLGHGGSSAAHTGDRRLRG